MAERTETTEPVRPTRSALVVSSAVLIVFLLSPARAEFSAGITMGGSWSDNIFLRTAPNEVDDVVYQVSPFIDYDYDSRHFDVFLEYGADLFQYSDLDETSSFHRGEFRVVTSGLQEALSFEVGARRAQTLSNPDQAIPTSVLPISGNLLDQDEFWANPVINQTFGNAAALLLDYRVSEIQFNEDDAQADEGLLLQTSVNHNGQFSLGNVATSSAGATWALRYTYQKADYEDSISFEFQRAYAELGYWVGQSLRVFGSGGQESAFDNPLDAALEDTFWEAGFAYSPSERFSAEFAAGERTFGSSWRGSVDFAFRRGSTSLRYSESPTTTGLNRSANAIGILDLEDIEELLDRAGTAERFVVERLEWAVNFELRRTSLSVSLFSEDRNGRASADGTPLSDESQRGASIELGWQAGNRTTFLLASSLARREFGGQSESDISVSSFGINYRISPRVSADIAVSQSEQQPRDGAIGPDYVATVASLLFTATIP